MCLCVSFLSSLLTAVLSHHLAWVFTVTRQQVTDGNGRHGKQSSKSVSKKCMHINGDLFQGKNFDIGLFLVDFMISLL